MPRPVRDSCALRLARTSRSTTSRGWCSTSPTSRPATACSTWAQRHAAAARRSPRCTWRRPGGRRCGARGLPGRASGRREPGGDELGRPVRGAAPARVQGAATGRPARPRPAARPGPLRRPLPRAEPERRATTCACRTTGRSTARPGSRRRRRPAQLRLGLTGRRVLRTRGDQRLITTSSCDSRGSGGAGLLGERRRAPSRSTPAAAARARRRPGRCRPPARPCRC